MKNKILILLAVTLLANITQAQSYTVPVGDVVSTIVRTSQNNKVVVYVETTSGIKGFGVTDTYSLNPSGSLVIFPINNSWFVRDMEIKDDYLFFCGESNSQGLVGWLNILALPYGGGITYATMLPSLYATDTHVIKSLRRMDVYRRGQDYSIAAVGDEVVKGDSGAYTYSRTCAVSATFAGSGCMFNVLYDKPGEWRFQDVACTNHFVVLTATDNAGMGCYVKVFENGSPDCFSYPIIGNEIYELDSYGPVMNASLACQERGDTLRIVRTSGPTLNLDFIRVDISPSYGIPVHVIGSVSTKFATNSYATSPSSANWRIWDYRFNPNSNESAVIGKDLSLSFSPLYPNLIIHDPMQQTQVYAPIQGYQVSIDAAGTSFVSTGISTATQSDLSLYPMYFLSACRPMIVAPTATPIPYVSKHAYNHDSFSFFGNAYTATTGGMAFPFIPACMN